MNRKIDLLFGEYSISAEIVVRLMVAGALQIGENGLKAGEPGIYKIEEIPTQAANPSGDE